MIFISNQKLIFDKINGEDLASNLQTAMASRQTEALFLQTALFLYILCPENLKFGVSLKH